MFPEALLRSSLRHWGVLLALELCMLAILRLSGFFEYGAGHAERPISIVVALLALAGVLHGAAALVVLRDASRGHHERLPSVRLVLGGALLLRATLLVSSPIQEDDFHRYLWDGRVSAAGMDPYQFSPAEIAAHAERDAAARAPRGDSARATLDRLVALRDVSPSTRTNFDRVNHPELATVYPPVAQAGFALVGIAVPDSWSVESRLIALRVLITLFDLGTLALLLLILRRLRLPAGLAIAYAWSPLVVKELVNSAHVDAISSFFLALSVWAALRARPLACGLGIGAAILSKYYAAVVFPLVLVLIWRESAERESGPRPAWRAPLVAGLVALAFIAATELVFASSAESRREVLREFVSRWEMHDAVFLWIRRLVELAGAADPARVARWIAGAAVLAIIAGHLRGAGRDGGPADTLARIFAVLAATFVLSPVGFPWYFTWCLPFVVFSPSRAWLFLPALLPIYYLRFQVSYRHGARELDSFDDWIVSAEFALFFVFWGAEAVVRAATARRSRRSSTSGSPSSTERSRPPDPEPE